MKLVSDRARGPQLPTPRQHHSAARLPDGRVAIVGGNARPPSEPPPEGACSTHHHSLAELVLFDPADNDLREGPALATAREHADLRMCDDRLIAFGGLVDYG